MSVGYNQPLYILPFDHRASFQTGLFGWKGTLDAEQTARVAASKQVVYEGFKAALAGGVPKDRAGILVDEQFGAAILADAAKAGFITSAPAEKSGLARVRLRVRRRLRSPHRGHGSHLLQGAGPLQPRGRRGDERAPGRAPAPALRVPARPRPALHVRAARTGRRRPSSNACGGDQHAYDRELRPGLMVDAIRELQDAGVEPDVWKIEGLDRQADCEEVVAAAQRDGRTDVGCIILGRGENEQKVVEWLSTAAAVPGFIGFAVGRTSFWEPLVAWRDEQLSAEEAAAQIANRYREWVDIFEKARA